MSKLYPFKIKPRHHDNLTRLILYASATYNRGKAIEYIPLSKMMIALPPAHRPLVKIALNVFFKQINRGSNLTGKCSMWNRRAKPRLNVQLNRMLYSLKEANSHVVSEMIEVVTSKTDMQVEITTKTVLNFPTEEEKQQFLQFISVLSTAQDAE